MSTIHFPSASLITSYTRQRTSVRIVCHLTAVTSLKYLSIDMFKTKACSEKVDLLLWHASHFDNDMWSGEVLRGDRIVSTLYTVLMNLDKKCEVLCKKPNDPIKLSVDESKLLAERIQEEYYVHLWVPSPLTTLFGFIHETWAEQWAKFCLTHSMRCISLHALFLLVFHEWSSL